MRGEDAEEPPAPADPAANHVVSVLLSFGKCLGALLPVYLAGYFGFNLTLVLFGLAVYMAWKQHRDDKRSRLNSAMYLLENEKHYTTTRVYKSKKELPAWVDFPDVEKVEWLNKILHQAWPFVGQYLEKLMLETIAPAIRSSNSHLQTFSFTKVDLGSKALKVVGVKAHTEHNKRQVLLDLHISFAGNVEINVEVKRFFCKAGVKGIQLHGKLRVILEPLIGDVPLVGAITMFFIRRPKLSINWTGLTNLLDIPGLNTMSDTKVLDTIASFLVLPNRITVPLVADLHVAQLRSPLPRGIVRIHLLEAENLAAKDNYIKGVIAGKSDPYAVLRVGTQTFTSKHVDDDLNPQWREMYEVIVHEVPGQELEVEVFDKDHDKDDFLGRMKLDLGVVKKARVVDEWFNLKDTASGKVHLRLEWLSLLPSAEHLSEVVRKNQNLATSSTNSNPPSAAMLTVYLDRAQDLPIKKGNKEPSPVVLLSVQDATKESRLVYGTTNPVWEDAFTFFIQDPSKQELDIQVKDEDRSVTLGTLSISLLRLLSVAELHLDQWFQLDKSGPASRIYMKVILRVLYLNEDAIPVSPVSPDPSNPFSDEGEEGITADMISKTTAMSRPEHTSPNASFATEGVLRIHLVKAQDLVAKDTFMGGMVKGKSDPYVKIRVGGSTFKSLVIKENLNPVWNEFYEVILTAIPGQEVQFELYDKDLDTDDFLGRFKMSLSELISSQFTDQWYTLNDTKSGRVHVVMEWVPRVSDPSRLEQILHYHSQQSFVNKAVPAAAILFVYVERAHALPLKKSGNEPAVGVELILKKTSYKTKVADRSKAPRWDETFCFLIYKPKEEILTVKLSHNWAQPLGALVLPVNDILKEPGLVLDRWFNLDGALPESQILLRTELKLLHSKLAQCDSSPSHMEEKEHIIPSAEASVAANQELRHRTVSTHGREDGKGSGRGQVKLTIAYSTEDNRLVIIVHACWNLPSCSKDGSDPYVSFVLLPDKNKSTKRKTSIKKRDLNPNFSERFDFEISLEEAMQKSLDLSVKNGGSFMSREKELIGKLQLNLNHFDLKTAEPRWYDLTDETK
ncbi:extended synaptotagmin-1 [Trichomycterus rosablanca]|uniref:extended synaptotagmin-1 n=1 Tax=Trichomycterus rosablanca TaxID=2290929 RepID=UPI002F3585C2